MTPTMTESRYIRCQRTNATNTVEITTAKTAPVMKDASTLGASGTTNDTTTSPTRVSDATKMPMATWITSRIVAGDGTDSRTTIVTRKLINLRDGSAAIPVFDRVRVFPKRIPAEARDG